MLAIIIPISPIIKNWPSFVKSFFVFMEQQKTGQKNEADDIFADFFKSSQAWAFNKTDGKQFPLENTQHKQSGDQGVDEKNNFRLNGFFCCNKIKRHQKRNAFHIPGPDPQLIGVIIIPDKNGHPVIGQGVEKTQKCNKQIGNICYEDMTNPIIS